MHEAPGSSSNTTPHSCLGKEIWGLIEETGVTVLLKSHILQGAPVYCQERPLAPQACVFSWRGSKSIVSECLDPQCCAQSFANKMLRWSAHLNGSSKWKQEKERLWTSGTLSGCTRKPSTSHLSLPVGLEGSGQSTSSIPLCLFLELTLVKSVGKYLAADIWFRYQQWKKSNTFDHFRELPWLK